MTRPTNTKARLIEAALELIWSCSYGATSVDAICEKANSRKGSFYHFFPSKSALAVEALETQWNERRVMLDALFAPDIPPLERISGYFAFVLKNQTAFYEKDGTVLGCPLFSLGCEVCTQDRAIGDKITELLARNRAYFEKAIADAHAEGFIVAPDPVEKARVLFAFYEGSLAQARIANSLEPIRNLTAGAMELLGVAALR